MGAAMGFCGFRAPTLAEGGDTVKDKVGVPDKGRLKSVGIPTISAIALFDQYGFHPGAGNAEVPAQSTATDLASTLQLNPNEVVTPFLVVPVPET
jgi:hypothetical protein